MISLRVQQWFCNLHAAKKLRLFKKSNLIYLILAYLSLGNVQGRKETGWAPG